jgi:hypothetical protein
MDMMKKLLPAFCVAGGLAIASCGTSTTPSGTASPRFGELLGIAGECSGAPSAPPHAVQVIVYRDGHVVLKQSKLGSHSFKFSLPAGHYKITTNQSYVVPVNVNVRSGRVAHASVLAAACD